MLAAPRAWSEGVLRLHERAWLDGRPFIALAEATPLGERLAALLEGSDWDPARALRVQTYALAGTLVARGLGYSFLDSFTAASLDPAQVVLLRLSPRVTFDLCMLSSAATPPSVLIGRLESSLRKTVQALAARVESRLGARPVCLG